MEGQSIYKKITVPEVLNAKSFEGVLFGKEGKALQAKALDYLSSRKAYLTALDYGANTRRGMVSILEAEKKCAESYKTWAKAQILSGQPDDAKVGCRGVIDSCTERLAAIEATLPGLED